MPYNTPQGRIFTKLRDFDGTKLRNWQGDNRLFSRRPLMLISPQGPDVSRVQLKEFAAAINRSIGRFDCGLSELAERAWKMYHVFISFRALRVDFFPLKVKLHAVAKGKLAIHSNKPLPWGNPENTVQYSCSYKVTSVDISKQKESKWQTSRPCFIKSICPVGWLSLHKFGVHAAHIHHTTVYVRELSFTSSKNMG